MNHFDEIPIKDLNKMNKEQEQKGEEEYDEDGEEMQKSLEERVESKNWKVRKQAYKELSSLFYEEG